MIPMAMQRFIYILIGWWFIDQDGTNDSNNQYFVYCVFAAVHIYTYNNIGFILGLALLSLCCLIWNILTVSRKNEEPKFVG